ncbi:MAG: ABC transporter permease, partial [Acidimicrobiales bacterium]|nr:ABC transporter permease [Acidimicrobiales bacterium]
AADVFLALDTQSGQAWKERFRAHPAYARYVTPVVAAASAVTRVAERHPAPDHPGTGWNDQVRTLLRRHLDLVRSDRRHLALLALQGPLLGLLLWLVLKADSLHLVPGSSPPRATAASETVAMFVALSATWLGASNAAREIVKERHIVRREVDAGLAPSAYVVSKAIVLGGITMVQAATLTAVACASQQPPSHGALLSSGRVELIVVGALVGLAATALGLLISAVVTSPDKALALLPMTLVTQLALAGGWASDLTAPGLSLLRNVTGSRWGVSAINATVAGDVGAWARAAVVLIALTTGSVLTSILLVQRHTRPAGAGRSVAARVDAVRESTAERSTALIAATAGLVLIVGLSTAVGPENGAGDPSGPRMAAAQPTAEAPAPAVPAVLVPEAPAPEVAPPPSAPPVIVPAEVVEPAAAPAVPVTTPPAPPEPPTPVAPEPTTTTTYYTPPASPPATPATPGAVTPATTSPVTWMSPWYWLYRAAARSD